MKTDATPFHHALAELATTMPPNADRLRQVRQRVERRRRRRMATGAAVSAGAVAAAVGIAMVPRDPRSSLRFNVAGPGLPECASVAAPEMPSPEKEKVVGQDTKAPEPDLVVRYKGTAIVALSESGSLTLGWFGEPGLLPPADSVVLIVDSETRFENNGAPAGVADVAVGQRVAFAASVGDDGRAHLDYLDLGLEAASRAADADASTKDGPTNPANGVSVPAVPKEPAFDGTVKGKAVIDAAPVDNVLAVRASFGDPDLQPVRLVLNETTQYFRYETACTGAELSAGKTLVFSAIPNADGSYTATELRTYE